MVQRSVMTYQRSPSKCPVPIMLWAGTGSPSLSSLFLYFWETWGTEHEWLGITGNRPMGICHLFAMGPYASWGREPVWSSGSPWHSECVTGWLWVKEPQLPKMPRQCLQPQYSWGSLPVSVLQIHLPHGVAENMSWDDGKKVVTDKYCVISYKRCSKRPFCSFLKLQWSQNRWPKRRLWTCISRVQNSCGTEALCLGGPQNMSAESWWH